jgi:SAM-dependent methyltransferase
VKLTGERPIEGKTPGSLLALHEAGYREVRARIGPGGLLDLGCGLGDGSATFLAADRAVTGVDYDPVTAAAAVRRHPGLRAVCSDGARLAVASRSFDWVCSSHLIEHFEQPEAHVAEVSRVLCPGGAAFFITPNAPADFENPYHVHLFEPNTLRSLLGAHFVEVEVRGLDGDQVVKDDFERRRRVARRLLALDVFGWRHRLPRRAYVALHATARRVAYPALAMVARLRRREAPAVVTADRFRLTDDIDVTTLVLFAVARRPREPHIGGEEGDRQERHTMGRLEGLDPSEAGDGT